VFYPVLGRIRLRRSPQVTVPRTDRQLAQILRKQGFDVPIPPLKKKRDNEEHRSQAALIAWWHHACAEFGVPEQLLYAVPNGGRRDPIGAKFLKREGQRNGAPDLVLDVARGGFHGLRIEMKAEHGVVSSDQRVFLKLLHAQGYYVTVAYYTGQAMATITEYLKGDTK
jgi:hypothetical protein